MKFNLSTVLAILACLGVFAPDVASVASMLAGLHITWMAPVVRVLGLLAAFCAAAPLIVPKLRPLLALLGLATPPGALAPWVPGKPGDPQLAAPNTAAPDRESKPTPITTPIVTRPKDKGSIEWLYIIAVLAIAVLACASIVAFAPKAGL
jgi:hypothetical protein